MGPSVPRVRPRVAWQGALGFGAFPGACNPFVRSIRRPRPARTCECFATRNLISSEDQERTAAVTGIAGRRPHETQRNPLPSRSLPPRPQPLDLSSGIGNLGGYRRTWRTARPTSFPALWSVCVPGCQALSEHRCYYGEPGGFVRRLHEGTWPAHILEHVTLELQNIAGMPGGFGRARETGVRGVYKVVVSAWHEGVTRTCLHAARDLVMAAITDTPFDVAATHARLRELAEKHLPGPGTACIINAAAAKDRGIPAIRLSAENLVQLGYGSRQRRIWVDENRSHQRDCRRHFPGFGADFPTVGVMRTAGFGSR